MTIAKKHAQSYMPNGEVSLADLIQAAVDEATETLNQEIAAHRDNEETFADELQSVSTVPASDAAMRLIAVNREVVELNERIRQLEKERVQLAVVAKATQLLKNERDDEAYALLVEVLAAAPAQEKAATTYTGPSSTACDDQLAAGVGEDM